MRAWLIPLLALPLMGQGLPRNRCDFGAGIAGLAEAERLAAQPIASLAEGRAMGEALVAAIEALPPRFEGCGCPGLAGLLREAAEAAGPAASEASAARILLVQEQVRFRLALARRALGAQGCR